MAKAKKAKAKNWALTELDNQDSLYLEIDGDRYEVVQYSSSFANNEMPRAMCMVGIGRRADTGGVAPATIHGTARKLKQMMKAKIFFHPVGEYKSDGTLWPEGTQVIFDGYYMGFMLRKINGRVMAILNLVHRSVDMGSSSTICRALHPSTPMSMTYPAVVGPLGAGGADTPIFLSDMIGHDVIATHVAGDLWEGIKTFLCGLSNSDLIEVGSLPCIGNGTYGPNTRAQQALSKIEGPAPGADEDVGTGTGCTLNYKWGVPLPLITNGIDLVEDAVAGAISEITLENFAHQTFWDVLVGGYCPLFSMAFVPRVETDLIIADTPAARNATWKTINDDDYDALDFSAQLDRPLRAVAVFSDFESSTKFEVTEQGLASWADAGGCYTEDSVDAQDGMVQFIPSPYWLRRVSSEGLYAGSNTNLLKNGSSPTDTTMGRSPDPDDPAPGAIAAQTSALYQAYAHAYYVGNELRGRTGVLSGKLRFDVAPGSNLRIIPSAEKFIGAEDDLVETLFGNVARVTISINMESRLAGTSFQLTHLRTEIENEVDRTSVIAHPLFGMSFHGSGRHGAPLVDAYEFPQDGLP